MNNNADSQDQNTEQRPPTISFTFDFSANDLLYSRTMNERLQDAKKLPPVKQIFDKFWQEGDICIFFGNPCVGKSAFAVQLADSITKGIPISGFASEIEAQKALLCDFELEDRQVLNRYQDKANGHVYHFSDNLITLTINIKNAGKTDFKSVERNIVDRIEENVITSGARIVIIDNITWLKDNYESAKDALPLLKKLAMLKRKYNLSLLLLAHPPKLDRFRSIELKDIAGSAALGNYIDSAFAIGFSRQDPNFRYLKQVKSRNGIEEYHTGNVCVLEMIQDSDFLRFQFVDFDNEKNHVVEAAESVMENKKQQVFTMTDGGMNQTAIARKLSISRQTVIRYLKERKADVTIPDAEVA